MFRFFELIIHFFHKVFIAPFLKISFKKCGKKVNLARRIKYYGIKNISVGSRVTIGYDSILMATNADIVIGDDVMFGPRVTVITGSHRIDVIGKTMKSITDEDKLPENDQKVVFEGDNWICANSTILKGVVVGRGSVVAAGAVVTKDVPPYSVVGGCPAKVIKMRFSAQELEKHKKIIGLE